LVRNTLLSVAPVASVSPITLDDNARHQTALFRIVVRNTLLSVTPDVSVSLSMLDDDVRHKMVFFRILMRKRGKVVKPRAGPTPSFQLRRWQALRGSRPPARADRQQTACG
jgi:hypothetical protein